MTRIIYADLFVGLFEELFSYSYVLLIPIILLEAVVTYFFVKHFLKFEISLVKALIMSLSANLFSFAVGIYPLGHVMGYKKHMDLLIQLVIGYFLSSGLELPIVYVFIKGHSRKLLKDSFKISFLMNLSSYMLLLGFILFNLFELLGKFIEGLKRFLFPPRAGEVVIE